MSHLTESKNIGRPSIFCESVCFMPPLKTIFFLTITLLEFSA